MSRTVPVGQQQRARARTRAPTEKSDTGPAARDRDPPPARLEPRLRGVHERVREDRDQLQPGALDPPPERRHRQPVRGLVHGHDREAPEQEHEPAEPNLLATTNGVP